MASPVQQQALQRKLLYILAIVALFTVSGAFRLWVVEPKAENLSLREQNIGDVELGGSALRLSLTGSRGFVVCALWNWAIDAQKKNRWNELELYVRSLTKLQPHFISPWLFQSWNLAYNVSVEADTPRDKFFYVSRGVELLAEGQRQNRNHPELRFNVGFYQQNKIGQSDETNVMRCLWQMACMRPPERDPARFTTEDEAGKKQLNRAELEKFCQDYPQFVRRMRDKLRVNRPEEMIQFLADNQRLPTLYQDDAEAAAAWARGEAPLRPVADRFPVMPPNRSGTIEPPQQLYDPQELTDESIGRFTDEFDCFAAARAWYGYAQEPIPPTRKDRPGRPEDITNPVLQRLPRMTTAIFRNYPPRAQSYIGERLQAEGWFGPEGWLIPDWFPADKFSDGRPARVGTGRTWSQDAWSDAHRMWERHGRETGILLTPTDEANRRELARRYYERVGLPVGSQPPDTSDAAPGSPEEEEYRAAVFMNLHDYYRSLTNFPHHYYRAEVEAKPETVLARRAFFEAEQFRRQGKRDQALRRYEQPDALQAWKQILIKNEQFREDSFMQEENYELQLRYMRLLQDLRGRQYRNLLVEADVLAQGAVPPTVGWGLGAALTVAAAPLLPVPEIQPDESRRLDGSGPDGKPLISDASIHAVKLRLGLTKPTPPPRVEDLAPSGAPPSPGTPGQLRPLPPPTPPTAVPGDSGASAPGR